MTSSNAVVDGGLMNAAAALPAGGNPICDEAGEPISCLGIDIQAGFPTPFGKFVRINVYTDDLEAFSLHAFAQSISLCEPLFVSPVEFLAIIKDGAEDRKGLGSIPGNAKDANLHD